MNLSLVQANHVLRYQFYVDSDASTFDAFWVELLDQRVLVKDGELPELWQRVLEEIARMRGQYNRAPLYHPLAFSPFVQIIACELAREATKTGLRANKIVGDEHPSHDERVRALCAALEQVELLSHSPAVRPTAKAVH